MNKLLNVKLEDITGEYLSDFRFGDEFLHTNGIES
jgi:hypothetical protein